MACRTERAAAVVVEGVSGLACRTVIGCTASPAAFWTLYTSLVEDELAIVALLNTGAVQGEDRKVAGCAVG